MGARTLCPLKNPKGKIAWDKIRWSWRLLEISPVIWTMVTNQAVSGNFISILFKIFLSLNILLRLLVVLHLCLYTDNRSLRTDYAIDGCCWHWGKSQLNCLRYARWTVTTDLQLSNCKTQTAFCWGVAIFVIIVAGETKQRKALRSLARLKLSSFLFHLSLHTTFYASSEW